MALLGCSVCKEGAREMFVILVCALVVKWRSVNLSSATFPLVVPLGVGSEELPALVRLSPAEEEVCAW